MAATVTESVTKALVGSTEDPSVSQQAKNLFMQHAIKDEGSDDYYLGEDEFVNAVAPQGEDYVSSSARSGASTALMLTHVSAQDQALPVCDPLPRR